MVHLIEFDLHDVWVQYMSAGFNYHYFKVPGLRN